MALRRKLDDLYDRQETNDLLSHLLQEEMVTKSAAPADSYLLQKDIRSLGGEEECRIFYSLAPDAWYRVVQSEQSFA